MDIDEIYLQSRIMIARHWESIIEEWLISGAFSNELSVEFLPPFYYTEGLYTKVQQSYRII